MQPLIITATANICWLAPDKVDYPKTPEAIVDEALRCQQAGATIIHTHAESRWQEVIALHRQKAGDLVLQCGMSSLPIPERMDVFTHHADMISMITSHHDEAFTGRDFHVLHPREELEEYMRLCNEYKVRPELEIWNTGSIWNMNYLIEKGLLKPPYFTTLFFDWPGGQWSPGTIEEYLHRRRHMPAGSVINVSIMGSAQRAIITAAIANGDHVRVGTEDNPYNIDGKIVPTHELVAEAAAIARAIGRPVATVSETRRMLGLA
ncbi:MAG: 3-keto-5-aminohexanoate cleavage protein [Anaerolineae bacterium]|nr:3-keto-5-aminohexanoate cleavage protein [Anaerolineae bacterium]